eukprot:2323362-Ditylum_brightwellii.AAC.1
MRNNFLCGEDEDENGVLADQACMECGKCIDVEPPLPSFSPSAQPSPSPSQTPSLITTPTPSTSTLPSPPSSLPTCVLYPDESPFNAGFGTCDTYTPGTRNNPSCGEDEDENGVLADQACMEC